MALNYNLSPSASLRTAAQDLAHPVEFVRKVLKNMEGMQGDSIVRLGLFGSKAKPNYRIEMLIFDAEDSDSIIHEQFIVAISGLTHNEMADEAAAREHWSGVRMTFREVQELLGRLRREGFS